MHNLLLYGDSNTYGYDPRGYLGGRYPETSLWTTLIKYELSSFFSIIEEGQNGRILPILPLENRSVFNIVCDLYEGDIMSVMLGTNDLLLSSHPNAQEPIQKMADLLDFMHELLPEVRMIVVGPPHLPIIEGVPLYYNESCKMNLGFKEVCQKRGTIYFDASEWQLPLAYDSIHLSEEGHQVFAKHYLENFLASIPL